MTGCLWTTSGELGARQHPCEHIGQKGNNEQVSVDHIERGGAAHTHGVIHATCTARDTYNPQNTSRHQVYEHAHGAGCLLSCQSAVPSGHCADEFLAPCFPIVHGAASAQLPPPRYAVWQYWRRAVRRQPHALCAAVHGGMRGTARAQHRRLQVGKCGSVQVWRCGPWADCVLTSQCVGRGKAPQGEQTIGVMCVEQGKGRPDRNTSSSLAYACICPTLAQAQGRARRALRPGYPVCRQ